MADSCFIEQSNAFANADLSVMITCVNLERVSMQGTVHFECVLIFKIVYGYSR